MKIKSSVKEYEVIIEKELSFISNLTKMENIQFVIDKRVYKLYKNCFSELKTEQLYLMEALELYKVIDTAFVICDSMREIPA